MLLDGPMNGVAFLAYVEQVLVPTLVPGDQVIMDNLPAHKVAGVKQAIEAAGATRLLLPPYSPDFNPIEQAFSKLKALLRKPPAPDLWAAIAETSSHQPNAQTSSIRSLGKCSLGAPSLSCPTSAPGSLSHRDPSTEPS